MMKRKAGRTKKAARPTAHARIDWTRFDTMTAEERHAAAMTDPDAKPLEPKDLKRMPRVPQVKVIRRALDLSQEQFAADFGIPVGTVRDWEQGRKVPDAAAKAYLRPLHKVPSASPLSVAQRCERGMLTPAWHLEPLLRQHVRGLVHRLGAPTVAVKTPALRALRALRPGTQRESVPVTLCVPGNRDPDRQVGAEVIRDLPPPCSRRQRMATEVRPCGYQLNGLEH